MITNSFSAMNWAKSLPLKRAPKVILTALISYIDLNTGRCTLSIAKIEKDWPYKARSIRKAFADLESLGLIEREFSSGVATTYRVCFDAQMPLSNESNTPANFARRPRQTLHVTPANFARRPRQTLQGHINYNNYSINTPLLSPQGEIDHGSKTEKAKPSDLFTDPIAEQPSCQPKATPSKPKLERIPEQDFDEFWAAYPRKEGKGSARKAFEKARRKISQRLLIRCVLAWPFAEKLSDRGDFRPHPATWLNNERWLDESVRHVLKVTDETPEQREAVAAFNRARDAYIAKISMGVTQSGMKMPVLEDFLAKHAQSTRRDNIAVH
ncbi:hypothetical protein CGLAMM_02660 [Acetobacteraceae bacterium EV16G]|uniref:hypothetical protein n=1 Tax=Sorlinia euscelidii TaxID=3081148 RepID=UPI002F3C5170